MTLVNILGILFLSLIIIIPLLERFGPRPSEEQTQKISRWILPLIGLLLLIQLIAYLFR